MKTRLKALKGLSYPEPGKSLEIVYKAGGRRKLTAEQRAKVKIKEVMPGEWCDDFPVKTLQHFIQKGAIEVVEIEKPREENITRRSRRAVRGEK